MNNTMNLVPQLPVKRFVQGMIGNGYGVEAVDEHTGKGLVGDNRTSSAEVLSTSSSCLKDFCKASPIIAAMDTKDRKTNTIT